MSSWFDLVPSVSSFGIVYPKSTYLGNGRRFWQGLGCVNAVPLNDVIIHTVTSLSWASCVEERTSWPKYSQNTSFLNPCRIMQVCKALMGDFLLKRLCHSMISVSFCELQNTGENLGHFFSYQARFNMIGHGSLWMAPVKRVLLSVAALIKIGRCGSC